MPIDYSGWKKIEVSDDEDETLKHVDTPALFRWRHQSRLEKMVMEKKAKDELNRKKASLEASLAETEKIVLDPKISPSEREKWLAQMEELKKLEKEYEKEEKELNRGERLRPWNVDTIGRVGFNTTRINASPTRSQSPPTVSKRDDTKAKLSQFYQANWASIRKFSTLTTFDETEQFLLDHPQLCCNDTATIVAAECCRMEEQDDRERLQKAAHQATVLNYLLEMAERLKWPATSPKLISASMTKFKKMKESQSDEGLKLDVAAYMDLVIDQMKEKKAAMKRQKQMEEEERKKRLGPGGLDPVEVLNSLPKEMRRCFQQKDLEGLKRVSMSMPESEFSKHLQRCIDSGLWVAKAGEGGQAKDEDSCDDEDSGHTCNECDEFEDQHTAGIDFLAWIESSEDTCFSYNIVPVNVDCSLSLLSSATKPAMLVMSILFVLFLLPSVYSRTAIEVTKKNGGHSKRMLRNFQLEMKSSLRVPSLSTLKKADPKMIESLRFYFQSKLGDVSGKKSLEGVLHEIFSNFPTQTLNTAIANASTIALQLIPIVENLIDRLIPLAYAALAVGLALAITL